jgi:hypothetical protein
MPSQGIGVVGPEDVEYGRRKLKGKTQGLLKSANTSG